MKFNYQARTQKGEIKIGVIEASSREVAISLLQKYGLYVTLLEEANKISLFARKIKLFSRIPAKEVVLFSRQLSIMFSAKVPLVESLRTLAIQTKNLDFKEKIIKISEEIEGGTTFSSALAKYPKIFSSFYVAMARAGEASGNLSESLNYLAEHMEKEYYLAGKIKGAMIYPAIVLLVVVAVFVLMILFVIPNLSKVLIESGQELPLVTRITLSLPNLLKTWGLAFLLAIIGAAVFSVRYYRSKKGKYFFDKLILKLPLFGPFLKIIYLARFAENFSTLISGGLPITRSLEICGEILGNSTYKEIIAQAQEEVKKGEQVSSILIKFPDFFPPLFTQMTVVGEKTGSLDKTLLILVGFYRKETEGAIENFLGILEPALIVFLGLAVGGLMGAVLMPLYKMGGI
ncbi:MAG: type II secretion system F family protein [bacterium]|nr:type II secretion system F family protein [bacterium]